MKNKTFILKEDIWICGTKIEGEPGPEENSRGKGAVALLNDDGYQCCLGQWARQANPSLTDNDLLGIGTPEDIVAIMADEAANTDALIAKMQPFLRKATGGGNHVADSCFSEEAMHVNDDTTSSIDEKVKWLRELLKKEGYKLRFIRSKKSK